MTLIQVDKKKSNRDSVWSAVTSSMSCPESLKLRPYNSSAAVVLQPRQLI